MTDTRTNPATAPTGWHYAGPAIFLHWAIALLIVLNVGLGYYMMLIEDDPGSERFFDLHKSFGIVIAVLVIARLAWRLKHPPAPLPDGMPRWQVKLALGTHWLLYAGLVVIPVAGFLGASFSKSGVVFFGLHFPAWVTPDHDLSEQIFTVHITLAWTLVALVALHVAGALKHLLVNRDKVFQRMWP